MSLPFEPLWVLALVVAVIWIAALLQSALGFGQALIAMPLITLLTDVRTASALVAVAGFSATLLILAGQRQHVNLREVWRLIVGSVIGVPLGVLFLTRLPEPVIVGGLGLMLIVFALYNLAHLQLPHLHQQSLAFGFGALAGMLGGAYNTSGPPLVVYGMLRRWTPEQFPATLQSVFLVNGVLVLLAHSQSGLWTAQVGLLYIAGLPLLPLAVWLGRRLNRALPREQFVRAVHLLLLVLGSVLLHAALTG